MALCWKTVWKVDPLPLSVPESLVVAAVVGDPAAAVPGAAVVAGARRLGAAAAGGDQEDERAGHRNNGAQQPGLDRCQIESPCDLGCERCEATLAPKVSDPRPGFDWQARPEHPRRLRRNRNLHCPSTSVRVRTWSRARTHALPAVEPRHRPRHYSLDGPPRPARPWPFSSELFATCRDILAFGCDYLMCSLFVHLLLAFRSLFGHKCPLSSGECLDDWSSLRNSSLVARQHVKA